MPPNDPPNDIDELMERLEPDIPPELYSLDIFDNRRYPSWGHVFQDYELKGYHPKADYKRQLAWTSTRTLSDIIIDIVGIAARLIQVAPRADHRYDRHFGVRLPRHPLVPYQHNIEKLTITTAAWAQLRDPAYLLHLTAFQEKRDTTDPYEEHDGELDGASLGNGPTERITMTLQTAAHHRADVLVEARVFLDALPFMEYAEDLSGIMLSDGIGWSHQDHRPNYLKELGYLLTPRAGSAGGTPRQPP